MARSPSTSRVASSTAFGTGRRAPAREAAGLTAAAAGAATFAAWPLEDVVGQLRRNSDAIWITKFYKRYLDFDRIDARLRAG